MTDPVVEAILELRFGYDDLSDLVPGKLADIEFCPNMRVERLTFADMPAPLRRSDPNLMVQPLFQLFSDDGRRVAKVGEQTFSWHAVRPYPGWDVLSEEFALVAGHLFGKLRNVHFLRLGLRYLNALNFNDHLITGLQSTNVSCEISGRQIAGDVNLNYKLERDGQTMICRIATPSFVEGPELEFALMVDLDVFTDGIIEVRSPNDVVAWANKAHDFLKEEFFSLLKPETAERLVGG